MTRTKPANKVYKVSISAAVPIDIVSAIDEIAERKEVSRSAIIETALEEFILANKKPAPQPIERLWTEG